MEALQVLKNVSSVRKGSTLILLELCHVEIVSKDDIAQHSKNAKLVALVSSQMKALGAAPTVLLVRIATLPKTQTAVLYAALASAQKASQVKSDVSRASLGSTRI